MLALYFKKISFGTILQKKIAIEQMEYFESLRYSVISANPKLSKWTKSLLFYDKCNDILLFKSWVLVFWADSPLVFVFYLNYLLFIRRMDFEPWLVDVIFTIYIPEVQSRPLISNGSFTFGWFIMILPIKSDTVTL